MKPSELATRERPNWCPGCGDYGIWNALKQAIAELELAREKTVIVSGIGCGSKIPYWVNVYGFHSLHGRAIPVAEAIKLCNRQLNVFVVSGDGDTYGEGLNHFIQALRRNINITIIVQNNMRYSLTKGQPTPTTPEGTITKITPFGVLEVALNPIAVAIASNASFVARGFAGNIKHLTWLIKEAYKHRGTAFIDVLQPCVAFNHEQTYEYYRERTYELEKVKHNVSDKMQAFNKALEWNDKIPIGIFYKDERTCYEEKLKWLPETLLMDISEINLDKALEDFS